jgi:GNAT superfamily N-acetyltransferase
MFASDIYRSAREAESVNVEMPRLAVPADLSQIQAIVVASYEKYLTRMDRAPAPMHRDYVDAIVWGLIWVIGEPIEGLISLTQSEEVLLIENVAVHPSVQGSGLGSRLMDFAESVAKTRGLHRLALYTNEAMTENVLIYGHLGFAEVHRGTEDGYRRIYMEKHLDGSG